MANELKNLSAQKRETFGKCENRRLRAKEIIPAVYYSGDGSNQALQVELKPLGKMYDEVGRTTVFNLDFAGEKHPAMFWAIDRDPCKGTFTHVDFYGVDLNRPVKVVVPVIYEGTAKGTKIGGVLENYRDRVTLMAKPLEMPARITVDVTNLDLNESVSIADLKLPEGVSAVYDTNYALVGVVLPSADEPEAGADTAAAPAAAAAPADAKAAKAGK